MEAAPEWPSIPAEFKFKVAGDAPFKIADLEIGCKCLTATADKVQYQPGEEGVIKASMTLGAHEGTVSKAIRVISNDSKEPVLELEFSANVPAVMSIEPSTVTWKVGDPAVPKAIVIKVLNKDDMNITNIINNKPTISHSLKVVKPGREYQLTLTPSDTQNPVLGLLTLETDCKITKYARRMVYPTITRGSAK